MSLSRASRLACAAALLAMLGAAAAAAAEGYEVPLTVTESAGVARTAEPISGGVPLPRGKFAANQPFRLAAADGKEIPCQVTPLVVETDGALRWVLLDFQDDVAAGATNTYTLAAAKPAEGPKQTLSIRADADGIAVDTGPIRFGVSAKKPFGLFDQVKAGGKTVVPVAEGTVRF